MDKEEINNAIQRYNNRLNEHGITENALGWGNKGRSNLRFSILCSEFDLEDSIILDFGCGFGDLYNYVKDNVTSNFKYIGIDINEKFINIAKERGFKNADFYLVDENVEVFLADLGIEIDYVLSSGIFNFKLKDNIGFIKNTLTLFDSISKKGFASNFLSSKVTFQADMNYHSNPSEILDFCYGFSNNLVLKNNYMPYEFSVFINKEDEIVKDYNVYQKYVNKI
jgi:SAM-dependent methyltransferase